MDKNERANHLLEKMYEEIRINDENSKKIRNWCITVWMASLAAIAYGKMDISPSQQNLFPFIPVLLFWLLDSFQNTFASLNVLRVLELEKDIADGGIEKYKNIELFYFNGYMNISLTKKMKVFVYAMVAKETVTFFYLLLFLVTLLFVYGIGVK